MEELDDGAENEKLCPQGGAVAADGRFSGAGASSCTPDNPILFPSPRTSSLLESGCRVAINRKLLKNAGIEEHVRFHDLRHTFATMAISSGVDVKTLSSMLGHYSAKVPLDTYTHITNDMQRGAAEKIGGFMESATATPTPEPPDPPEQSRCKVIPFEKVG